MANSVINENDGKLTEVEEKSSNPTEPTPVKIKGIFTSSSETSRSEKYELVLDRFRLYVNGKAFADNIISASASADYFVYVTREGRIRIISDEKDTNEENNNITASAVIAHPQKPVIWYLTPDGGIFESAIGSVNTESTLYSFNDAEGSILCRSYDSSYCWDDYSIENYNEKTHFDYDKLSAEDCALHYFKQTPAFSEMFTKQKNRSSEEADKLILSRIRINSFSSKERSDFQTTSQGPVYDFASVYTYKDYKVSFTVVDITDNGNDINTVKKLCDRVPEGFTSFYDYIYNEYL